MTGFESKRQMAKAKLDDEADTLLIVYQRGFADGKRSEQRKPLTTEEVLDLFDAHNVYGSKWLEFARAIEQAHNIKEQP
tara:strand:- start:1245 stop:1481 length:237 start_codon:yes stop_codon:yes gene_type:complete